MDDIKESQKDNYILFRGGLASARLTTQHFVLTDRQGWLLHPVIEETLKGRADVRIADLATGNGIWATSLSKAYPTAKITGLDISSAQFPPSFTCPNNVTFDIYNMFDPVPQEYQSCFDVIHIRLIVAAIYDKDKGVLLSNLLTMLKPGGYLQWDEVVGEGAMEVDSSLNVDRGERSYMQRMDNVTGFMSALRWADHLPRSLKEKGFEGVLRHDPPLNTTLLKQESDCLVWSLQELINFIKEVPKEGAREEMTKAAEELQTEIDAGKLWAYNWEVALGRKPIEA